MKRHYRDIEGNSQLSGGNGSWNDPRYDFLLSGEDSALLERISEYLRGRIDMEDVRNDPLAGEADNIAREIISNYAPDAERYADSKKFIVDNLAGSASGEEITSGDIMAVKKEIGGSKVDEIAAEWVRDWSERGQKNAGKDSKASEIRDFITSSLEIKTPESGMILPGKGKGLTRSLLIRYISLSAAAVTGIIILISSLLPSPDPVRLFNAFYEPFNIISPVTRGMIPGEQNNITDAVNYYKAGDYQQAALGFSVSRSKDTSDISLRFYLGITHLALGNNDQAIDLLNGVIDGSGEFMKEACWYLGLACLKSGEKERATEYFKLLAQVPGFYGERSEKLLRRLK